MCTVLSLREEGQRKKRIVIPPQKVNCSFSFLYGCVTVIEVGVRQRQPPQPRHRIPNWSTHANQAALIPIDDYIHRQPAVKWKPLCFKVTLGFSGEFQWTCCTPASPAALDRYTGKTGVFHKRGKNNCRH